MIRYRPFRNCDPPAIADVWFSQPELRRVIRPMTPAILDDLVLAKPYFDPHGLIVADEGDRLAGFAHAGFGPNREGVGLDHQTGVISLIMVRPEMPGVADGLLRECEAYLRQRGAATVLGGGTNDLAPFYLGLYGGSRLPGVLESDKAQAGYFRSAGYTESSTCTILERRLAGFRPAVDRETIQLRRHHRVVAAAAPPPATWWQACHWDQWVGTYFEMVGSPSTRGVSFWDIEPLASSWGVHAMGLWNLFHPDSQAARETHLVYLLGESMRALQSQHIASVEIQALEKDDQLKSACSRLGFEVVDKGIQFQKHD